MAAPSPLSLRQLTGPVKAAPLGGLRPALTDPPGCASIPRFIPRTAQTTSDQSDAIGCKCPRSRIKPTPRHRPDQLDPTLNPQVSGSNPEGRTGWP